METVEFVTFIGNGGKELMKVDAKTFEAAINATINSKVDYKVKLITTVSTVVLFCGIYGMYRVYDQKNFEKKLKKAKDARNDWHKEESEKAAD